MYVVDTRCRHVVTATISMQLRCPQSSAACGSAGLDQHERFPAHTRSLCLGRYYSIVMELADTTLCLMQLNITVMIDPSAVLHHQHVLTPNTSNTASWSVALFKV